MTTPTNRADLRRVAEPSPSMEKAIRALLSVCRMTPNADKAAFMEKALKAVAIDARAEGYAEAQEQAARVAERLIDPDAGYEYDETSSPGAAWSSGGNDSCRMIAESVRAMEPEGLQPTTKGDGT